MLSSPLCVYRHRGSKLGDTMTKDKRKIAELEDEIEILKRQIANLTKSLTDALASRMVYSAPYSIPSMPMYTEPVTYPSPSPLPWPITVPYPVWNTPIITGPHITC